MKKRFILMIAICTILSILASCDGSVSEKLFGGSSASHKVTFDSNGGTAVQAQTVKEGEKATKPSDPTKAGFELECWTKDGVAFDFDTETITEDMTLVAKWKYKTYSYGDIGPAGGWIFYDVDADNDVEYSYFGEMRTNEDGLISSECGWRYLEAAVSDLEGTYQWGLTINSDVGGGNIGDGKKNTAILVAASSDYAAAVGCDGYSVTVDGIVYDEWFLPSASELYAMYENLQAVDSTKYHFNDGSQYWSSSKYNNSYAVSTNFSSSGGGGTGGSTCTNTFYVRPARVF